MFGGGQIVRAGRASARVCGAGSGPLFGALYDGKEGVGGVERVAMDKLHVLRCRYNYVDDLHPFAQNIHLHARTLRAACQAGVSS